MKTEKEINLILDEIISKINKCNEQLPEAQNEMVYNLINTALGRLEAQRNILLEILK